MERSGSRRLDRLGDAEHLTGADYGGDVTRKRSLIRPERQRVDRDHPQFHYQQASQQPGVQVHPSSTGHEPAPLGEAPRGSTYQNLDFPLPEGSEAFGEKYPPPSESPGAYDENDDAHGGVPVHDGTNASEPSAGYGDYRPTGTGDYDDFEPETETEKVPPPLPPIMSKEPTMSLWAAYCRILTFPVIPAFMRPFGMKTADRQMAWREKIGLISVILMVAAIVGYLTFGFTQSVCKNSQVRIHWGAVPTSDLVISGNIYDLSQYVHPQVPGFKQSFPVLYTASEVGGKDGSFLFQNVNGHCLDLVKPKDDTKIPHENGRMGWYFPCQIINLNGTLVPDSDLLYDGTTSLYEGWACHTSMNARNTLYNSHNNTAVVYFTWDDMKNPARQLVIYNGDVLDLSYLDHLLTDDLTYPPIFDELKNDKAIRGMDITQRMSYGQHRKAMLCLRELTKVGAIDTDTIGCIASKVVLYVSLVFILGLVVIKFLLACYFRFVIARKQGAFPVSNKEFNEHENEIEDWANNIYSSAPLPDPLGPVDSGRQKNKRRSVLLGKLAPNERTSKSAKRTTMTLQNPSMSTSRVVPGGSIYSQPLYRQSMNLRPSSTYNHFHDPLEADTAYRGAGAEVLPSSNASSVGLVPSDGPRDKSVASHDQADSPVPSSSSPAHTSMLMGPVGGEDEYFVPQPPVGYQPFGYPLAHCMCLVTAYSESVEGLRTTLDSIATTEYPNSHKLIVIICDGLIKGSGNTMSTPEICLSMMDDYAIPEDEVEPYSYVSVVSGAKRHNMAKVYAGFYKYDDSTVDHSKQQRVPVVTIVKCGTSAEANDPKPGNRGKRDSQIILMTFLERVMFDERMTELDFEMFNGIRSVTGIAPDFYEVMLMVDADTKVFPDALTHMVAEMVKDPQIMGLCGETMIANKTASWVTAIQVFEYFISHHQAKAFESVFGGVTCLPGCFSMYRIKSPKGGDGYWVPILCNPDIVERYSDNVTDTLHKKNLLLLGEDRYLSSLMLRTFPRRKMIFVPKAACKTIVPDEFKVLLSQRRRWINSTIHNLMELVLVRDLCGVFIISMQFVVFIDLVSTLVLPAAISFTIYIIIIAIVSKPTPTLSLILLALILGLPGVLIIVTATRASYVLWMLIYLLALPIWNFVLPTYAYWKFDDFSWGDTRTIEGGDKGGHDTVTGEFDSSNIVMKRWREFQRDRARLSGLAI